MTEGMMFVLIMVLWVFINEFAPNHDNDGMIDDDEEQ